MQRILSFAIMTLALVAFCAPSLARGLEAVAAPSDAVYTMAGDGEMARVAPGCKQAGGKRLLPCHPDLGVLTPGIVVPGKTATPHFGLLESLAASARWPDAELPPPRRG